MGIGIWPACKPSWWLSTVSKVSFVLSLAIRDVDPRVFLSDFAMFETTYLPIFHFQGQSEVLNISGIFQYCCFAVGEDTIPNKFGGATFSGKPGCFQFFGEPMSNCISMPVLYKYKTFQLRWIQYWATGFLIFEQVKYSRYAQEGQWIVHMAMKCSEYLPGYVMPSIPKHFSIKKTKPGLTFWISQYQLF